MLLYFGFDANCLFINIKLEPCGHHKTLRYINLTHHVKTNHGLFSIIVSIEAKTSVSRNAFGENLFIIRAISL